jgi:ribosome assembly protein YihI (activator of Der GTPase)
MVFYCESAAGFSNDIGCQDEGYFDALVNMFEQALKGTCQLSARDRDALIARLDRVRTISHNLGYGVGDDMDDLLAKYVRT